MRYPLVSGWLRLGQRRWRTGLLLFLLVAVSGTALVLLSRPVYRAEARLRLGEPPPMSGVSPGAGFVGLLRMGGDPFANDLELLASRTLAERIVDDAALHVRVEAPRGWHRRRLFSALEAGRGTVRAAYPVRWSGDVIEITLPAGRVLRVRAGEPARFGDVSVVFRPWRTGMPRQVVLKTMPHGQAARELAGRLVVERTRRDANVVRVRYQHHDPELTRLVVAAAVDRFVALRTQIMKRESGETVDSLRGVAARAQRDLAEAEAALEAAQSRTGLVAPEAQLEAGVERHSAVLARLETGRIELRALDDALARSAGASDAATSWAALLAYPRFLANPTVGELLTSLSELEQTRRELARRRTESNVELRAVLDQIEYLDRSLRTVATDFASSLRAEVSALEAQVATDRRELAAAPAHTTELARRQRALRILTEIVVLTEQRLRQEELRQALTFANVQVIDPPALRDRPIWPRRKLGPAIAILLAGATALLGMVVVDRADDRLRTAAQVHAVLGAPAVATVHANGVSARISGVDLGVIQRQAANGNGRARVVLLDVNGGRSAGGVAEAIRRAAPADGGAVLDAQLLPPASSYGSAATAAAARLPVFVVVEVGSTTRPALTRAVSLLRQAGADVAGAVLVCRSEGEAAEVWS